MNPKLAPGNLSEELVMLYFSHQMSSFFLFILTRFFLIPRSKFKTYIQRIQQQSLGAVVPLNNSSKQLATCWVFRSLEWEEVSKLCGNANEYQPNRAVNNGLVVVCGHLLGWTTSLCYRDYDEPWIKSGCSLGRLIKVPGNYYNSAWKASCHSIHFHQICFPWKHRCLVVKKSISFNSLYIWSRHHFCWDDHLSLLI